MQRIKYAHIDKFCALQSRTSNDLRLIAKQISQLVAKSWLPGGEDIRKVFLSEDSKKILRILKKEGIDLESFFGPSLEVRIDTNTFEGYIEEIRDSKQPFVFVISYPPKPTEFNVSDKELKQWVKNDNSNQFVSDNPYIPITF